jgi:hypothetical protein
MLHDDYSSITTELETTTSQVARFNAECRSCNTHCQIYLSLVYAQNKLGAAFYEAASAIIYFMPDVEETARFDITQQSNVKWLRSIESSALCSLVLVDIEPSLVVCSAKTNEDYYKALSGSLNGQMCNNDDQY